MVQTFFHQRVVLRYQGHFCQAAQYNKQKDCDKNHRQPDLQEPYSTIAVHHPGSHHVVKIKPVAQDDDGANYL